MDPLYAVVAVGVMALLAMWLFKRYLRHRYGMYDVTKKRAP